MVFHSYSGIFGDILIFQGVISGLQIVQSPDVDRTAHKSGFCVKQGLAKTRIRRSRAMYMTLVHEYFTSFTKMDLLSWFTFWA